MKITKEFLESKDACADQAVLFAKEWPEGAEVTLDTCLRAAQIGLDFGWAATALLPFERYYEYLNRIRSDQTRVIDAVVLLNTDRELNIEGQRKREQLITEYRTLRANLFYEFFAKENI